MFSIGSFIHKVAKTVGITSKDSKENEHKEQFTALVREVKGTLNANNCPYLSVSILPHVNSSGNYTLILLLCYLLSINYKYSFRDSNTI